MKLKYGKFTGKIVALLLSGVLLAGCAAGNGGAAPAPAGNGAADAVAVEETHHFRVSTHYPVGHPAVGVLERAIDQIYEASNGRITMQVFPSSVLGDYILAFEELMRGSLDLAFITVPSVFDSRLGMVYLPYMLTDYSQMPHIYGRDSFFFQKLAEINAALGVELLGIFGEGLIGIGFGTLAENFAIADAVKADILVRTPPIEAFVVTTQDMGFVTTSVPFADLYTALQTGVADAWIGGPAILNYTMFRDVINYFVSYNVFVESTAFLMSQSVFNRLSEGDQRIIQDAFMDASLYSFEVAEEINRQAKEDMRAYGIEVIELTDEQMQAYVDLVREVTWPRFVDLIGQEIVDGILAYLDLD